MLRLLPSVKEDLKEWLDEYSHIIDDEDREKFIHTVYDYALRVRWNRDIAQDNKKLKKTYKEREPKAIGYASKLIDELGKAPTPRGEMLIERLEELLLIPSSYIYDTPKTFRVTIDEVDIYLNAYSLDKQPRRELLDII